MRQFDATSFDTVEANSVTFDGKRLEAEQVLMLIGAEKDRNLNGPVVMYQISSDHVRSLVKGNLTSTRRDEFIIQEGLPYSARVLKGNTAYSDQFIEEVPIEDQGIFIYGLCTATAEQIERLLKSSNFCAENGIDAERIVKIHILKEIIDGETGEKIPIEVFKERLVARFASKIPKLQERLNKLHFIVWERVMPIAERVFDLDQLENPKQFFRLIRKALNNINRLEALRGNDVHFSSRELDKFFIEYLIPNIARNLGKLHKGGVATSGYCAPSNIDLSGALCDLEDLIGTPIDPSDKPITEEDCVKDTFAAFSNDGILDLLKRLQEEGLLPDDPNLINKARKAFFTIYFNERFGEEKAFRIGDITKHIAKLPPDVQIEILEDIYGINLLEQLTPEELLKEIDINAIQDISGIMQAILGCAVHKIIGIFGFKYGQVPTGLVIEILKQFGHLSREGESNYIGAVFKKYFSAKYNDDQTHLPDELVKALEAYPDFPSLKLLEQLLGIQFNIGFTGRPEKVVVEYAIKHGLSEEEITQENTYKAFIALFTKQVTDSLIGKIDPLVLDKVANIVVNAFAKMVGLAESSDMCILFASYGAYLYKKLLEQQDKI